MSLIKGLGLSGLACALFALGCSSRTAEHRLERAPAQAGIAPARTQQAPAVKNAGMQSTAGAEAGNAGGASGAAGEDGGAGSAGNAGSGGTGSTTEYVGSHCSPGQPSEPMLSDDESACRDVATYHSIPNGEAVFAKSHPLPEAMVAGEPYSFSTEILHTGRAKRAAT
jgi:hypothetical protein